MSTGQYVSSQLCKRFFPTLAPLEKCALGIMLFATFQIVIQKPYIIIAGERHVNIFSGLLCALSLITAWSLARKRFACPGKSEILLSAALLVLAVCSGLASPVPRYSLLRGLVMLASGLGGYWSARLLLRTPSSRKDFTLFCFVLFALFLSLQVIGYIGYGSVHHFFDEFRHPQVSVGLLLCFAPLALLFSPRRAQRTAAILLLCIVFFVFFFSGLRSAVFMPIAVAGVALLLGFVPLRWFCLALALFALIGAGYFALFPEKRLHLAEEPAYYRLENYPFSLHVALKHPLLGAGLSAPRESYLKGYTIRYPHISKEKFAWTLKRIRVSENIFLTFVSSLGFPFFLLFVLSLAALFLRLIKRLRAAFRSPGKNTDWPHPLILFIPLTAGLLHFLVYDGLLHPQVCWLYALLLGLIHPSVEENDEQPAPRI